MEPLEHVLSLLKVGWLCTTPLQAGGQWALAFDGRLDLRIEKVVTGGCWVVVEGRDEPLRVEQGDCYVVVGRRRYRLASDLDTDPVPAYPVYRTPDGAPRKVAQVGEGWDTTITGAGFIFDPDPAPLLFDVLPPLIHVSAALERAPVLRTTLCLLAHESQGEWLGQPAMMNRLAHMLLLQALREHTGTAEGSGGLLAASLHPQLGAALRALHTDITQPWSVADLAGIAGLSRSTFSLKFRTTVGLPPVDYLLRVRMHAAARALRETDHTVAVIAASVGYGTESAFSVAFKRVYGISPSEYRLRPPARRIELGQAS
ncbi:AraC family transcriptional regulator [Planotetraspora phitsanulokensis]|uniref:AraC family transcriptional regulator n=1 Tax=Planotetraspora phitsanulokensis TaxID=575192 RepID=UPI00194EAE48|nr:AraC family transcriptional regulator [Planotetraspora phitsanulokensis]